MAQIGSMSDTQDLRQNGARDLIEEFEYPAAPDLAGSSSWLFDQDESLDHDEDRIADKTQIDDEKRRSFEAGVELGRQEGRQAERAAYAAALKSEDDCRTRQAAELIASFAAERDRFMQAVEQEVVKLALAVAARILRREAQIDPLLLTGAVRVALGQLAGTTEVHLIVPPAELDMWTDAIAHLPNLAVKPVVRPGEGMRIGDCVVETALGSVDLGIRSQLGEIERGFFDRASKTESLPEALAMLENNA